ncbi:AraC family transcriptional regulator [Kibdelosporangium aridum]|uniref:AraC family transcriptional regulator n=1 Tax=Kibdelosporangium aridum TaxID=2030 RepID=UPI0035ED79C7
MEWVRYRRLADRPVEAMHAHFEQHRYHMHSHDSYSFGLTDHGAQTFGCRGSRRTSAAGMVMAFNPDEPHDGRAENDLGFTYRIIHIDPSLVSEVLSDQAGRPAGLPLFTEPVLYDPVLAGALNRMYNSLVPEATALARDEALAETVAAMVRRAAMSAPAAVTQPMPNVQRARDLLDEEYLAPLSADDLATAAGCSRFALYRAFKTTYGMTPSDYQRQLRLRSARRLLRAGVAPAEAAVQSGFADQAHLTRWFRRYYGVTPGTYQRA